MIKIKLLRKHLDCLQLIRDSQIVKQITRKRKAQQRKSNLYGFRENRIWSMHKFKQWEQSWIKKTVLKVVPYQEQQIKEM